MTLRRRRTVGPIGAKLGLLSSPSGYQKLGAGEGSIKEVVGKAAGGAKLEAEGDKVEGKVKNAFGGLKDTLKSTVSTR